jgi:hypothetical protein
MPWVNAGAAAAYWSSQHQGASYSPPLAVDIVLFVILGAVLAGSIYAIVTAWRVKIKE